VGGSVFSASVFSASFSSACRICDFVKMVPELPNSEKSSANRRAQATESRRTSGRSKLSSSFRNSCSMLFKSVSRILKRSGTLRGKTPVHYLRHARLSQEQSHITSNGIERMYHLQSRALTVSCFGT